MHIPGTNKGMDGNRPRNWDETGHGGWPVGRKLYQHGMDLISGIELINLCIKLNRRMNSMRTMHTYVNTYVYVYTVRILPWNGTNHALIPLIN